MSKTNPRITKKERNAIKGYVKRVFSRSELRDKALERVRVYDYHDPGRPRVQRWCFCPVCGEMTPEWKMQVDHVDPVVPVTTSFAEMSFDELVDRQWCHEKNLQPKCIDCHEIKTASEIQIRSANKKLNKGEKK